MLNGQLIWLPEVDSTNTYARGLLENSRPVEGTTVVADYQHAGRGQQGTRWLGEQGKNLYLSYITYPSYLPVDQQFLISKVAALAVLECIGHFLPNQKALIKWPNDLLIDDEKAAGILIENSIQQGLAWSIIGIGLNVNQKAFQAPRATSLLLKKGMPFSVQEVASVLRTRLAFNLHIAKTSPHKLESMYLSKLWRLGEWCHFRLASGGEMKAEMLGVAESGQLLVRDEDKTCHFFSLKEASFVF